MTEEHAPIIYKKEYDSIADEYDKRDSPEADPISQYTRRRDLQAISDFLEISGPHYSILDIACGTGRAITTGIRNSKNLVGVDISIEMLKIARSKQKEGNILLVQGNVLDLPVKDSAFDVVTCLEAFQYFPLPTRVLKEMARVTKDEGFIIMTLPNALNLTTLLYFIFRKRMLPKGKYTRFYYTPWSIKQMLESEGFRIIRTRGTGLVRLPYVQFVPSVLGVLKKVEEYVCDMRVSSFFGDKIVILAQKGSRPDR